MDFKAIEKKWQDKWAKEKADWYDPIIAKDDELLGQRNHQQDKEQKSLKKKYSHFW